MRKLTLVVPASGTEQCVVFVESSGRDSRVTFVAQGFIGVLGVLGWLGEAAALSNHEVPARRCVLEIEADNPKGAVGWLNRVFSRNGGATPGARDILAATGLLDDPEMLVWVL